MIRKYATLETISSSFAKNSLRRSAHRADFSQVPVRPGYLYVRSRAISSRTNDNFDTFPAEEIKKGYLTFIGKPVFVNHENENHRRARGVILDAQLHEDTNPDGSPDTWVEVLMEVDAINFPKLAEAIVKGHIERTSMGVDVEMSKCGACGNEARTPLQYCSHIPRMKGSKMRKVTASGTQQEVLIHEVCYGLEFFENSLLVEEPADPTAFFLGVDTRGLEMQATKRAIATRKKATYKDAPTLERQLGFGYEWDSDFGTITEAADGRLLEVEDIAVSRDPVTWEVFAKNSDGSKELVGYLSEKVRVAAAKSFGGKRVSRLARSVRRKRAYTMKPNSKCAKCGEYIFFEDYAEGVPYGWFAGDDNNPDYSTENFVCAAGGVHEPMMAETAKRKVGYGEVIAPPAVDTLRQDECPICGSDDYNGDQCMVCGFIKPPEMYMDPDLEAAGLQDLRQEQGLAGNVDAPNAMSGDMTPGLDTNNPVVENVLAGDVQELQCDSCDASFNYDPTMAHAPGPIEQVSQQPVENPSENPANDGPLPHGDPQGQQPPPVNPNAATDDEPGNTDAEPEPPAGEELPKNTQDSTDETHDNEPAAEDTTSEGEDAPSDADTPVDDEGDSAPEQSSESDQPTEGTSDTTDEFDSLKPGDPCPECGGGTLGNPTEDNPLNATDENPDPDGDGDDDRLGSENDPDHAENEQEAYDAEVSDGENKDDEEDSDEEPSQTKKKSNKEMSKRRRTSARRQSQKEDIMARPLMQAVAEQQKLIKKQAAEIARLKKQVARIETLAGLRATADAANPAQPIPQPDGAAGVAGGSLEEARTPKARGNVSDIGGVAETTNVGAYTTDSVDNIGGSAESGYTITQDVTTPVAGTETMRPIDEVRTRPVIEFGDPLKPNFAFPLEGDFAQRATVDSSARIYASLRLARLRIEAGTNEVSDDEIAEGEAINADETKSDEDIQNEIETTSKILNANARKAPRKAASRNLVPKAAGGRQVPSVAKSGGIQAVASAPANDDPFLFI